jgi:hypothetical protein
MVGKVIKEVAEAALKQGADVENLKRLGYLTEESAQNPRAVKSAQTKYQKSVASSKTKAKREAANIAGETKVIQEDLGDRPIIRPEDLEDTVLISHKGDVTGTNVTVTELGGIELPEAVTSYGGARFPMTKENQEAQLYWASMRSAATPLQNKAETLEQVLQMPVSAVYTSMGREGNYFNQAFADALLQKTQVLNPPKAATDAFDAEVRKFRSDWVGIRSPQARSQLLGVGEFKMEGAGKLRSTFVKEIQKARWRDQGFATIGNLEQALLDPALKDASLGDSGFTIGRIGGDYGLTEINTHPSYNTGIMGEYLGGLAQQAPPNILFPDAWEKLGKELTKPQKGGTPQPLNYAQMVDALSKRKDLFQIADARWVDSVSKWLEENGGKTIKAAIYAVGVPVGAFTVLDPSVVYADALDAVNASTEGELNEEQVLALQGYAQMQEFYGMMSQDQPSGTVYPLENMPTDTIPTIFQPTFTKDDATGKLLTQYEDGSVSSADKALQEYLAKQKQEKGVLDTVGEVASTAGAFAKDVAVGVSTEGLTMILSGFLDATAEMAEIMESIIPLGGETLTIDREPRTVTGGAIKGVSQFLTGFFPAMRALKGAGVSATVSPWLAGAFADAAGFDAHEERLSDLIQEYPALQNPVTEYLQSDPTDSEAEGRFKNALEGAVLGGMIEPFVKVVKFIRSRGQAKAAAAQEGATVTEAIESDPEAAGQLQAITQTEQEFIPFREEMGRNSAQFEFKAGSTAADPEAAANINLNNIETPDDIKTFIDQVAEADAIDINAARREKITNVELPKLANDLGMTVDDLLARRQGEAFNAEQILAARKILVASGEHLIRLAKKASTGGDMDLAMFRRAMAQHKAIQAQVSGMTAEAGRALQSFNIVAASSREQERAIKEALEASGGIEVNQRMAQMMSQLDDPTQVGKFVKDASKATKMDMLYEVWINGLLSSPTTHTVNALSNIMVAALTVGERRIASMFGDAIQAGESTAQLKGMVDGARDGFRLAWHALKTGEPSDVMQKVEVDKHKAISSENLNIGGYPAVFANFLGNMVRIPGRLLTTSDEFFKAVGYRMELHAQAYRQAFNEGLRDEAAAKRVLEIINDPPENIRMAAVDASRYQTFTNSLSDTKIGFIGEVGKLGEKARSGKRTGPYARVIIPFVRTPTNIMSYTFERTPLAFLSKSVREELSAGGARKQLALGKIAAGSMIMSVAADLALSGQITGAGPTDPQLRNIKRTTGWQPYSIKVGDKYYAYGRLDPVGALIGLAADMSEIMGQVDEATADQLATAAVLSIVQNMSSKTYMSGVTEFLDALDSSSTDPEANNWKLNRYLQRLAGSMVPATVANIERVMSPEMSATYGYIDRIKSRIPGYSDDLPPRRNIFGEPVVLEGGIGPDIMSPIYQSTDKKDPVADEIVRQQADVAMPRRAVNGVELTPQQYDRYILLYSGEGLEGVKGVKLKDKLKETFASSQYRRATDGPEGNKVLVIKSIFTTYRDAAKAQLIREEPSLQAQIETEQRERFEKLTGRRL